MAIATVNGVRLFYKMDGSGEIPLILVHGSWSSHHNWDFVVPRLAESFRVLTYDRRGHSQSECPAGQGSVREDVADLAGLIEHLGLKPAWVVGNSFGASIVLRLVGERPDLLQGLIVHEPPLFSLLSEDPALAPMLDEVRKQVEIVVKRITSGDHAGAAEHFIESIALGPGEWAKLPSEFKQTIIENAPTFLDEANDPELLDFDFEWIKRFSKPALVTMGDQSPPTFAPVVAKLAEAMPTAKVQTYPETGHVPQVTHPEVYADAIAAFVQNHSA